MKTLVAVPKGFIRDTFFPGSAVERLRALGEVEFNEFDRQFTETELVDKLKDVDFLVTGWGQPLITYSAIKNCRRLKMIAHTGGTIGGIVHEDVFDTGIRVLSGNRYYAESVAEGVLAYMLFALRSMGRYSEKVKQGIWPDGEQALTEGLLDQTVGLISLGAISRSIIQMAKPFRIKFKVYSTSRDMEYAEKEGFSYADLDEIFSTCKIVSVHTARTPQTINMINERLLNLLDKDSIFINTSRGEIVEEQALIELLKANRFRAVLDVYNIEPLPSNSQLRGLDNVILFPHMAGPTTDRRRIVTHGLIDDMVAYMAGAEIKNIISKSSAVRMTH